MSCLTTASILLIGVLTDTKVAAKLAAEIYQMVQRKSQLLVLSL